MWFSISAAAIAPGIALLCYFYLKDKYEAEPISMVIRLFIFGAFLVFPTMLLQRALELTLGDNPFFYAFILSAGVEECLKWLVVYYVIYKHVYFDEPYDGIVYAVALFLGFATIENLIYSLLNFTTFSGLLFRAFLPVSAQALFGVMMGYQLGKAKFNPVYKKKYLFLSLFLPFLFHGVFDYILLEIKNYWGWLIIALMLFLWARSLHSVSKANDRSPFRGVLREDDVKI